MNVSGKASRAFDTGIRSFKPQEVRIWCEFCCSFCRCWKTCFVVVVSFACTWEVPGEEERRFGELVSESPTSTDRHVPVRLNLLTVFIDLGLRCAF